MKMKGFPCFAFLSMFGLICADYTHAMLDNFILNSDGNTEDCFFNFCNTTEGYPSAKILKILERNKKVWPLFENGFIVEVGKKERISRSLRDKKIEVTGCKTVKSTYFPLLGRNLQDVWKTIVNVEQFKQEIVMESCQNNGEPCSRSSDTGRCQQRFENTNIMTVSEKGTVQLDTFSAPSGCICT